MSFIFPSLQYIQLLSAKAPERSVFFICKYAGRRDYGGGYRPFHGPKKRKRYLSAVVSRQSSRIHSLVSIDKFQNICLRCIMAPSGCIFWRFALRRLVVERLRNSRDSLAAFEARRTYFFAEEEHFDCTVRDAANDAQVLNALNSELKDVGIQEIAPDHDIDNSVEIMLPLAALRFPEARLVWLRVPPDYKARELGSALARAASTCRKKLAVIASTDLTHYGPNYGFMPHGVGESAVDWVRNENDRGFINAVLSMDTDKVLGHARDRFSACSSGAVAAAISFSLNNGAKRGVLIGHKLSFDMHPDRSFVGYAAIAFVP